MGDQDSNRFKSLIQPIKDLASNWDIDVAEELNDYLEELATLRISVDGGQTSLNFAEAALLIQGSTAIYSKKVEYLYQLVLQSIEFITNKKSSILTGEKGTTKHSNDIHFDDEIMMFGNDPSFLLLDHIIEEGQNINLKSQPSEDPSRKRFSSESNSSYSANNLSRVSMSLMHSMLNEDNGVTTLKLASSILDTNGALLVNAFRASNMPQLNSSFHNISSIPMLENNRFSDSRVEDSRIFNNDFGDNFDFQDDYDPIAPNEDNVNEDFPRIDNNPINTIPEQQHQQSSNTINKQTKRNDQKVFVLLDPHSVANGSRPVQRGRPYRIPKNITKENIVKVSLKDRMLKKWDSSSSSKIFSDLEELPIPSKGIFETCFQPLFKMKRKLQMKQALQAHREQMKLNMNQENYLPCNPIQTFSDPLYEDLDDGFDPMNNDYPQISHHSLPAESNDLEIIYGGDDQYQNEGGDFYQPQLSQPETDDQPIENDDFLNDEDLEEEELARRVDAALNEDLHLNNGQSYEMICKQYIESFQRGANAFVKESLLSKRVSEWTLKLEPILQAQEESRPFDIHEYSDEVLVKLDHVVKVQVPKSKSQKEPSTIAHFSDIVQGETSGEVCRSFLACLQLANLGNIDVDNNQKGSQNDFTINLLKVQRSHVLENFRAPSVISNNL